MDHTKPYFRQLFAALFLIWLVLNLPLLLGIRVLPWDAMDEFYPTVYFNVHSLRLGLAPWWNPHIYAGYPQIADPQGMLFSPLLMAWMLLREAPGPTWFTWGVLLHVLMGGTAMLGLLRRDGANALGALLGATVFMAGGVAASRLEHTPIVIAYAYAPVILLSLRHFLAVPGIGRGALFGLAAGAMCTQLVQVSYLLTLMIAVYALAGTWLHWMRYDTSSRWRWCTGILVAMACALALSLPQLLLSWGYMGLSNRTVLPLSSIAIASLDLRAFLTLLDPNAFHALRGKYSGPASLVEAYLYIGTLPLLMLAGMGGVWRDLQQRRQLLFFAASASFACLYMLGSNTPFYAWLYSWMPGMQHLRRPVDAAYLFNLSLAIVAGLSASHLKLQSRRQLTILLALSTCLLALASFHMRDSHVRWQAGSLAAAAVAFVALCFMQRPCGTRTKTLWLLLILVVDYRCFNLNGSFNESRNVIARFSESPSVIFLGKRLLDDGQPSPRIETLNTGTDWDNQVTLHDMYSTQGYNPLRYELYASWYGARESSLFGRADTLFNPAPDSVLNQLLDVKYLVVGSRPDARPVSPPAGFTRIFTGQHEDIWQAGHAYAPWLTPIHAHLLAAGELPPADAFSATNFNDWLWLTPRDKDDENEDHAVASTCTDRIQATMLSMTPTSTTFLTNAPHPGWLVVSELDFPGWKAELEGKPLPIHRANGMFRAVCVPGGKHRLRFSFHPWAMVAYTWNHRQLNQQL
ncbi:hypothetical protein ACFFJT_02455 [Dyella flava]|uniref:YfhO family protein n=1 Tax=Dyella flava TaxID=1920170 RepID=A0ABS2K4I9_9GAMM|nr:hypothetical protein [Dyella flava]MBM7126137.1 hypothetical protein [Dyella flava]GLQ49057.1 hypothetical protein GCM10010872_05060 [Dyella flava]